MGTFVPAVRNLMPACVMLPFCAAQGIGRTGTFCAIDILLQRLDAWPSCQDGAGPDRGEVEAALNLPALVHELRRQRMGMVQTLEQVRGEARVLFVVVCCC
jgi:protein tyrosine phosphatase